MTERYGSAHPLADKCSKIFPILLLLVLVFHISHFTAFKGHYNGGSFKPNDYFTAPPGFIIPAYYGYANMDFYKADAEKSNQLGNAEFCKPTSIVVPPVFKPFFPKRSFNA